MWYLVRIIEKYFEDYQKVGLMIWFPAHHGARNPISPPLHISGRELGFYIQFLVCRVFGGRIHNPLRPS